jgi:YggT family protein
MSPAVAAALIQVLEVYTWIVLARVLLSWVIQDRSNPVMRVLDALTDPVLAPLSRFLTFGGIDVSPILLIFALQLIQRALAGYL